MPVSEISRRNSRIESAVSPSVMPAAERLGAEPVRRRLRPRLARRDRAQPQVEGGGERPRGDRRQIGLQVHAIDLGGKVGGEALGVGRLADPQRCASTRGSPPAVSRPQASAIRRSRAARSVHSRAAGRRPPSSRAGGIRRRRCAGPPAAPPRSPSTMTRPAPGGRRLEPLQPAAVTIHSRPDAVTRSAAAAAATRSSSSSDGSQRAGIGQPAPIDGADRARAGARQRRVQARQQHVGQRADGGERALGRGCGIPLRRRGDRRGGQAPRRTRRDARWMLRAPASGRRRTARRHRRRGPAPAAARARAPEGQRRPVRRPGRRERCGGAG